MLSRVEEGPVAQKMLVCAVKVMNGDLFFIVRSHICRTGSSVWSDGDFLLYYFFFFCKGVKISCWTFYYYNFFFSEGCDYSFF